MTMNGTFCTGMKWYLNRLLMTYAYQKSGFLRSLRHVPKFCKKLYRTLLLAHQSINIIRLLFSGVNARDDAVGSVAFRCVILSFAGILE